MRVIAGSARHLLLKTPAGMNTRPTTDRIKETLFNILQNDLPGAVFIDVFSGSGGIGIEALSRGADKCYFIENQKEALNCIRENLRRTKLEQKAVILPMDAAMGIRQLIAGGVQADILFMDPPYDRDLEKQILEIIAPSSIIHQDSIIIAEASGRTTFSYLDALGLELWKQKSYGSNQHVFLSKKQQVSNQEERMKKV